MRIKNLFNIAFKSLLINKTRSLLTSLGIIIGVTAVILLVGIGQGLQNYITEQFESLGSNKIFIFPGRILSDSGSFSTSDTIPSSEFNQNDVNNLEKALDDKINYILPIITIDARVKWKNKLETTSVTASLVEYNQISNINPDPGRFYTKSENNSASKVIILGSELASNLFGNVDPIGKDVQLSGTRFEVIGIAEEKGSTGMGPSLDTQSYIPLKTAQRVFNRNNYSAILIEAADQDQISSIITQAKKILRKRFSSDEFSVVDQTQILSAITGILGALTAGIGGIAAISLLVGGIGISNIMLVSVTERTREIGLRKALGATPRVILIQFLIESVLLSFGGGLIGVLLGVLGCLAMQNFFPAQVTFWSIALAFGVSAIIGIVFGIIPARRAAKLSPINALRYE